MSKDLIDAFKNQYLSSLAEKVSLEQSLSQKEVQKGLEWTASLLMAGCLNKGSTKAGASELFEFVQDFDSYFKEEKSKDNDAAENTLGMRFVENLFGSRLEDLIQKMQSLRTPQGMNAQRLFEYVSPFILAFLQKEKREGALDKESFKALLMGQKEPLRKASSEELVSLAQIVGLEDLFDTENAGFHLTKDLLGESQHALLGSKDQEGNLQKNANSKFTALLKLIALLLVAALVFIGYVWLVDQYENEGQDHSLPYSEGTMKGNSLENSED